MNFKFRIIIIGILIGLPGYMSAQVNHWEALVRSDQSWNYFPGNSDPGQDWNQPFYDASAWASGAGGIGYGDDDDSTIVDPVISVFLRKEFEISDKTKISEMVLNIDYDDGFIAYLNGVEIARSNLGESGNIPMFNDSSNYAKEARLYQGLVAEEYKVPFDHFSQLLINGNNLFAVQVHNQSETSSDLSIIPNLLAGIIDGSNDYFDLPSWVPEPIDFTTSKLPIISINTNNENIIPDARISAEMGVIDNGPGMDNKLSDPFTGYEGKISIKIRGESAKFFAKKSYSLETQDSVGNNLNYPLLGFPEENDWILYGPYSDKSLVRNVFTYHLSNEIGQYATRTKFLDLFINDEYLGLYVLMEKIKRDKNRVDISKLNPDDVSGDQLTGGYILRIDKIDDDDYPPWESYPDPSISGERPVVLQYFDPDGWELLDVQKDYIKKYILDFESALSSETFNNADDGYRKYADVNSFVDHLILTEITKNVDGYFYSTYMYKNRDDKGGKLTMGPAWDFNISMGNVDYAPQILDTAGWVYEDFYRIYWFRRLMEDPEFENDLNCRYHELRGDILSDAAINSYLDNLQNELQFAAERNFRRWPILGEYIWPNAFIGNSFNEEFNYLTSWLSARLNWLDNNIDENCVVGIREVNASQLNIYPNPVYNGFSVSFGTLVNRVSYLAFFDLNGRKLAEVSIPGYRESIELQLNDLNIIVPGIYIIAAKLNNGEILYRKIVKK